ASLSVVVSHEIHRPYPHKTTQREPFGRALVGAHRAGASDAVLVTAAGFVAEGTAWSLFWWDNGTLCTPAADLGILPGVGRQRVMELAPVREEQLPPAALTGRSLFLVNSVRGIVEIGEFNGHAVPSDPRTAELSASFWPD
ncbi:MAG TPA: aminotransferase class IV, partial [Gemmatimonadales bacterium]|nr:aminotransferase class IV [Gemmatimonadales bacterium]